MLKAGVATHVCDAARIGELEESLLSLQSPYPEDVAAVLDKFHEVIVLCVFLFCFVFGVQWYPGLRAHWHTLKPTYAFS